MHPLTPTWRAVEALHDIVYFAPTAVPRFEELGLKGFRMSYFASRSAVLGAVPPEVVVATFHGFAPRVVRRALPDAWGRSSPADVLATRFDVARQTLAPALGDDPALPEVADELVAVVGDLDLAGKALAAAHAATPAPEDPVGRLWWAATVLRELRGDCHVAALVAAGLGGADANALAAAVGHVPDSQGARRGWTDEEWAAAYGRLRDRGWVNGDGAATEEGRQARQEIEDATDLGCSASVPPAVAGRLCDPGTIEALTRLARAAVDAGLVPYPNPVGAPPP